MGIPPKEDTPGASIAVAPQKPQTPKEAIILHPATAKEAIIFSRMFTDKEAGSADVDTSLLCMARLAHASANEDDEKMPSPHLVIPPNFVIPPKEDSVTESVFPVDLPGHVKAEILADDEKMEELPPKEDSVTTHFSDRLPLECGVCSRESTEAGVSFHVTDDDVCRLCGTPALSEYYCNFCVAQELHYQLTTYQPIIRCLCRVDGQRQRMNDLPRNN